MAYQASGLVSTSAANSQRVLYHIRRFILGLNPPRVTIVSSNAAGGNWDSEAGPGDGSWLVIQGEHEEGGVRWQAFIGGRSTAGNLSNGFPGSYNGLYVVWAPDGGWSDETQNFGSHIIYGPYKVDRQAAANMGPFNMEMSVVERIDRSSGLVDGECFIWLGDNAKNGSWDSGFFVGHFYDCVTARAKQTVCLIGYPTWEYINIAWGYRYQTTTFGCCWNTGINALDPLFLENSNNANWGAGMLLMSNGAPFGFPLLVYNAGAGRVWGYLPEIYRTDASIANGTRNDAGTRVVYNGLIWPSKA